VSASQVVLVEDESAVRLATAQTLELGGFQVLALERAEDALASLPAGFSGVLISDVRLPGKSGLELLAAVQTIDPEIPVIIITGHGDVSMAVQAMRDGAYDFIEKPFSAERLLDTCLRAQEKRRLVLENRRLRQELNSRPSEQELIGSSAAIEKIRQFIRHIGPTPVDVLIHGATGTGKEVVARQLHLASGRRGEFVAINCGALPESMFESEIFGHEAGAFTGAQKRRIGKLEYANGGTIFLDEIESMPLNLQVKLLRVLQERRLERLGGNAQIAFDCRIIAATKEDLLALASRNQFREDLYFRLAVVSLYLPALNDRRDDIPQLLDYFVQKSAARFQLPMPRWSLAEMQAWQQRDWSGNVRELRNFADKLVLGVVGIEASGDTGAETFAMHSIAGQAVLSGVPVLETDSLPKKLEAFEISMITQALRTHQANVAFAADSLGIPKKTLYDKLKKYQIPLS
jgi:two-component system C4-dicarboxylate transport response regulator DctD